MPLINYLLWLIILTHRLVPKDLDGWLLNALVNLSLYARAQPHFRPHLPKFNARPSYTKSLCARSTDTTRMCESDYSEILWRRVTASQNGFAPSKSLDHISLCASNNWGIIWLFDWWTCIHILPRPCSSGPIKSSILLGKRAPLRNVAYKIDDSKKCTMYQLSNINANPTT